MSDLLTAPDLTAFSTELQAAADRLAGQSWPDLQAKLRPHVRVIDQFETLESFVRWGVDWTGSRVGDGLADRRSTADGDMAHRFGPDFVYDVATVDPAWVFPRCPLPGSECDQTLCDVLAAHTSGHPTMRLDELHELAERGERPAHTGGPNQLFPDDGIHRLMLAQRHGLPAITAVIGRAADRPEPTPDLAAAIQWLTGAERDEMLARALPELREAEAA